MAENIKHRLTLKENITKYWKEKGKPYFSNFNNLFYYVVFLFVIGILFFISSLVPNLFTILPSGDYVYQSVPFFHNGYDDWWKFFTTGEFPFWDPNTFLGADNLANNAFYYVMDPFFLLTLFFPRAWIVQIMAIIMILKMVLAAVFFRLLLKSYGVEERKSRIFSMCYGFGGWMIFYCWFNVFMEAATWLPLVLLGIEKILKREKPFVLIFSLFALGLSNFYFLIPICIGGVLYALFRLFQAWSTRKLQDNVFALGMGVISFALGIGLAAFFVMPAILGAMSYHRSESSYLDTLFALITNKEYYEAYMQISSRSTLYPSAGYRSIYPLLSFLFPLTDGRTVGVMDFSGNRYDELASSIYPYAPVILLFFASIFKSLKDKKISHIIAIVFFSFALSWPFFYYMFLGFTKAYGRWEIIAFAFIILYVATSYNKSDEYKKWYFDAAFVIQLSLMVFSIIVSLEYPYQYSKVQSITWRWIVISIQFIYATILWLLFRNNFKTEKIVSNAKWFIMAEACVLGIYYSISHGYTNYLSNDFNNGKDNVTKETEIFTELNKEDTSNFRVQSDRISGSAVNIAMQEGYNGISVFHSTYNSNIDQFFNWSRIINSYGNWTGNAIDKRPLLDTFLGVKYYFTKRVTTNFAVTSSVIRHVEPNIPFGYKINKQVDDYTLYENENYIETGFTFDSIIDPHLSNTPENDPYRVYSDFFTYSGDTVETLKNDNSYLSSAIYSAEDIEKIKDLYKEDFETGSLKDGSRIAAPIGTLTNNSNYTSKIYRLDSNFDPDIPLEFLTKGDSTDQSSNVSYAKSFVVMQMKNGGYFNSSRGDNTVSTALYIKKPINDNYKISYFLINDKGQTVTYDNNLQLSAGYKNCRTLYTGENNIKYIIGVPHKSMSSYSLIPQNIYNYSYTDYLSKIEELKKYPLTDHSHTTNTYSFKTNFENRRAIVLNVPYDKGWSCEATLENGTTKPLDVYKSTGGFVSTISEKGNVSYKFSFTSYYFKYGMLISIASGLTIIGIGLFYELRKRNKKKLIDNLEKGNNQFRVEFQEELKNIMKKDSNWVLIFFHDIGYIESFLER